MSTFFEKKEMMKGMAEWRVSEVCLMMCLLRTQWKMEMQPLLLLFVLVQGEYEYVSCDYEGKHQRADDTLIPQDRLQWHWTADTFTFTEIRKQINGWELEWLAEQAN